MSGLRFFLGFALFLFCLLGLVLPGLAADAEAERERLEAVARKLQETYDRTESFQARFTQLTAMPMSHRQREGSGTVAFRKPHQMRWEYEQPDHQVLVSDGDLVRMYFARSNQLMIQKVSDYLAGDVTYAFFSGSGDLLRDFTVEPVAGNGAPPAGTVRLRLVPRDLHPQVEYLEVEADEENYLIRRLEIVDHFGSVTTLIFSRIELNPQLAPDFYRFEPPSGTEILSE